VPSAPDWPTAKLLLVLASTVILGSESHWTHGHIILSFQQFLRCFFHIHCRGNMFCRAVTTQRIVAASLNSYKSQCSGTPNRKYCAAPYRPPISGYPRPATCRSSMNLDKLAYLLSLHLNSSLFWDIMLCCLLHAAFSRCLTLRLWRWTGPHGIISQEI
jgi:hypothetical protein